MPTVQATYPDNIPVGYAGGISNQEPSTLISRNVETAAGIGFGLAVEQGTEDMGCVIGAGTNFLGVTVRDQSVNPETPNEFAQNDSALIITKGVVWVAASTAVDADDPVSLAAAGALGTGGSEVVAGARWDTSAAEGALARLRLA